MIMDQARRGAEMATGVQVRRYMVAAADGVRLAVEDSGPVDADYTVFLAHGLCLRQVSWAGPKRLLRSRFGNRIRIVSYDHRGHGHSDSADAASYTVEQLGCDLAAVLAAAAVGTPTVVAGHSMGAMALLEYLRLPATRRPVDPDALVLVATAAGRLAERGVGRLLNTPLLGVAAGMTGHTPHGGGDRAARALLGPACRTVSRICGLRGADRDALASTVTHALYSTPLATAIGFLPSLKTFDAYNVLPAIQARTVVVSGGADLLTPVSHTHDLVAEIPGAIHRHVADAGHMLLHEAPQVVADAIASCITAGPRQIAARPALVSGGAR